MERTEELEKDFREALSHIDFKKYDPYSREFMKALFIGQMWSIVCCLDCDDDVEEELDGARKYMGLYKMTGDNSYKEMAGDELKHAGILIKKSSEHGVETSSLESERKELLKSITKVE